MHQRPVGGAEETVVDEEILVHIEIGIAPFQIAGAIALDAVTQGQVLGARRGADRVGLDEAELRDRAAQCRRCEQRPRHGITAQIV